MACETEKQAASAAVAATASACTSFGAGFATMVGAAAGQPEAGELWPPCFAATQAMRPALEALANCAASAEAGGGQTGGQISTFLQQLEEEIQQIVGLIPIG